MHFQDALSLLSNPRRRMIITALQEVGGEAFKPIIHHGGVFHVLDGEVRYEFHMAAEGDVER